MRKKTSFVDVLAKMSLWGLYSSLFCGEIGVHFSEDQSHVTVAP
jgi:hypothetical protein